MNGYKSLPLLLSILFIWISRPLLAVGVDSSLAAGSAVNAETGLNKSKRLINLLDPSMTNLGSAADKKIYRKIIVDDLRARVYLRQFQYSRSYKVTRTVHKNLVKLTHDFVKRYIRECNQILSNIAGEVIQKKNTRAKHYLRLSFRDIALAKEIATKADHINPASLYSMKAEAYLKAIRTLKRGMRFTMLIILELRTPLEEKKSIERLSFEEMGNKLWYIIKKNRSRMISIHFDNYNQLQKPSLRESFFQDDSIKAELTKGTSVDTPTAR